MNADKKPEGCGIVMENYAPLLSLSSEEFVYVLLILRVLAFVCESILIVPSETDFGGRCCHEFYFYL